MLFLSVMMGGVLGVVQGYAWSPYNLITTRLSIVWGYRLFFGPHKEVTAESRLPVIFVVIGLLLWLPLYLLPVALIAIFTPELNPAGYGLSWSWLLGIGVIIYRRKQERKNPNFR